MANKMVNRKNMKLSEVMEARKQQSKITSQKTIEEMNYIHGLILGNMDDKPVSEITKQDCADLHKWLTANKSQSTAKKAMKLLHIVFNFAHVQDNPCTGFVEKSEPF